MLKKWLVLLFSLALVATQISAQEEDDEKEENPKWFFLNLGIEGSYLKTTTEEFFYSPTLEIKIKKLDHVNFGLEGGYYGNKVLYDGTSLSEVIRMGEVIGRVEFFTDSDFTLGFEGSKRFGQLDFNGLGGGVNLSLPLKETVTLEGSLNYDKNEYSFGLNKITETVLDIDADFDFILNDAFSWMVGANYNATEYSPTASTYSLYNAYTNIFVSMTDSWVVNVGVKIGRDSSSYIILGAMGGLDYTVNEILSINLSGNYTLFSKGLIGSEKKGKKSPYGGSSSFSNYSITGAITLSF